MAGKENWKKKIARLNSKIEKKEKKELTPEQKKRRKKIKIILGTLAFATILGLGIGIPLGVTNTKVKVIEQRSDNDIVAKVNGKNIIMADLHQLLKSEKNIENDEFSKVEQELVTFLYNEELKAEQKFKEAWDNSFVENKTSANDDFKTKLKSLDEIKAQKQKIIDDEKERIQKTFGFNNWETEFNKFLATDPRFNKAISEEQAINFLVNEEIKNKAFSRFKTSISKNFRLKDIKYRVLKKDIVDDKNNVIFKQGERLFKDIIVLSDTNDSTAPMNAKLATDLGEENNAKTEDERNKIIENAFVSAFMSESFVKKYMNAFNLINEFYFNDKAIFKDKLEFYNISKLNLKITADILNPKQNWKIDQTTLKELLGYSIIKLDDKNKVQEVKTIFDLIENFKGAQSNEALDNANDRILLNTISKDLNSKNGRNLGQESFKNIIQIFDENVENGFILLDELFKAEEKEKVFSQTILMKIKENIFKKYAKEDLLVDVDQLKGKDVDEIRNYNDKIVEFINSLTNENLEEIGKIFKEAFSFKENTKLATLYLINKQNNLYMAIVNNQVVLFNKKIINKFNDIQKAILDDIQVDANNNFKTSKNPRLNLNKIFQDIEKNEIIVANLLNQKSFDNHIRDKLLKNQTPETKDKYINNLKRKTNVFIESFYTLKGIDFSDKVNNHIEKLKKNNSSKDLIFKNNIWQFINKPNTLDSRSNYEAILNKLKLQKGENEKK
ncbi:HinT-interacting membrane complex protein P80 [[Mycoplasma] collis]|uniref:HinT-interacting membrane complex protein P80 n=1 Tax=[Mycoplasma] collis TaxID=2127 RepID=UPI00051AF8C4|nr:hypothetical protein [[Mycoplasma] collis]